MDNIIKALITEASGGYEDLSRDGLLDTPKRAAKAWQTWLSGYGVSDKSIVKLFETEPSETSDMVIVTDIPVRSMCEHHLAPFFGYADVAYVPNKKTVLGLSKFIRLVNVYARRLQVQERLTAQYADSINKLLNPAGVMVVMRCRHTCMETRGVQTNGVLTTTSVVRGIFHKADVRMEALTLIGQQRRGV